MHQVGAMYKCASVNELKNNQPTCGLLVYYPARSSTNRTLAKIFIPQLVLYCSLLSPWVRQKGGWCRLSGSGAGHRGGRGLVAGRRAEHGACSEQGVGRSMAYGGRGRSRASGRRQSRARVEQVVGRTRSGKRGSGGGWRDPSEGGGGGGTGRAAARVGNEMSGAA